MPRAKKRKSTATEKPGEPVTVRPCHGLAEFGACFEIQRAVWASADADLVPVPLFVVAAETGGQVLGAFADDRMVGFTLALAGARKNLAAHGSSDRRRAGQPFLHSHMTAVLEPWRDRGVGRSLKLYQRTDALSRGIELIEWTFDPLQVKNAYFNLARLGAIAPRYVANMYGTLTTPLQAGLPSDRLVAEWHLDSARVRRAVAARTATRLATPSAGGKQKLVRIRVPAELAALHLTRPDEAIRMQAEIRQEFEYWLNLGYAAVSAKPAGQGGEYLLQLWPKD